MLEYFGMQGQW